jgi:hypothetical protein
MNWSWLALLTGSQRINSSSVPALPQALHLARHGRAAPRGWLRAALHAIFCGPHAGVGGGGLHGSVSVRQLASRARDAEYRAVRASRPACLQARFCVTCSVRSALIGGSSGEGQRGESSIARSQRPRRVGAVTANKQEKWREPSGRSHRLQPSGNRGTSSGKIWDHVLHLLNLLFKSPGQDQSTETHEDLSGGNSDDRD